MFLYPVLLCCLSNHSLSPKLMHRVAFLRPVEVILLLFHFSHDKQTRVMCIFPPLLLIFPLFESKTMIPDMVILYYHFIIPTVN